MTKRLLYVVAGMLLAATFGFAQRTGDPYPEPIPATDRVIAVKFVEFATLPDSVGPAAAPRGGGVAVAPAPAAPRVMTMLHEPGTKRFFASDMNGKLFAISADGKTVTPYLDLTAPDWKVSIQAQGSERGLQSFAFHPQFSQTGARGFGKFYTYTDTSNIAVPVDFKAAIDARTHDIIVLEWTAKTPGAATYDGAAPRELIRIQEPYANHNGGHLTFNPYATPTSPDYGLLYVGLADGGSGGDPNGHAQNLGIALGKILRLDPLGTNSANGKYGIPASNPFVSDGRPETLGEIYAYGVRNPQRLFWDPKNGSMFMSDIGQDTVEEISPVTPGANLGWNVWEGNYKFIPRPSGVDASDPRSDTKVTYPIAEYGQLDPLLQGSSAAIGGLVYRSTKIPQLANLLIFGDNPSGEIFYVNADNLPKGGQDSIRRILLNDNGTSKTFLQVIKEKNTAQGRNPATRADLRFAEGPDGQIFITNKRDGVIRLLVP
jgi:glucose/arabinose dehydrogenase